MDFSQRTNVKGLCICRRLLFSTLLMTSQTAHMYVFLYMKKRFMCMTGRIASTAIAIEGHVEIPPPITCWTSYVLHSNHLLF